MGRWLELLLEVQFVDRAVALGAKALLALLPALVTVAAFAPPSVRLSMAATLQRRMGLSGDALDLVRAGFSSTDQGSVSAGVVGGLLTVFYATTFTSALRRMYLHTRRRPLVRDRMAHVKGLAWIGAVVLLTAVMPVLVDRLDAFPVWIVWMPRTVVLSEAQYGYFGVFMTIVSWLVGLAFVVVGATALGPVLATTTAQSAGSFGGPSTTSLRRVIVSDWSGPAVRMLR